MQEMTHSPKLHFTVFFVSCKIIIIYLLQNAVNVVSFLCFAPMFLKYSAKVHCKIHLTMLTYIEGNPRTKDEVIVIFL